MLYNNDIYFDKNYGKLYEKIEYGAAEIFRYENEYGVVENQYIKTIVPNNINGNTYYIISTPYGYGGPRIINCQESERSNLVQAYAKKFEEYCVKNNIIYEFVRFHPVINNAIDFQGIYNLQFRRKTVGTNLIISDDPIKSELTKQCRKTIRNILNKGVEYEVVFNPDNIDEFKPIYYETLNRNQAVEDYYFSDEYFKELLLYYGKNIVYIKAVFQQKTISADINFVCDGLMQAHLSAVLDDYLHLSPAYITTYASILWGLENNCSLIHYGGGRTADPDDGLYLFKKKFSQNTEFDYYISEKIWNKEIYEKLCHSLGNKGSLTNFVKQYYRKSSFSGNVT